MGEWCIFSNICCHLEADVSSKVKSLQEMFTESELILLLLWKSHEREREPRVKPKAREGAGEKQRCRAD